MLTTHGIWGQGPMQPIRKAKDGPGDVVSVDHIISHQLGLMPQVTGIVSNKRYSVAVLIVDNATDFIYLHLIESPTTTATMAAKYAFEWVTKSYGVTIKA